MPVLRTWPRRSVSMSDAMPEMERGTDGWAALSDDENDQKRYPVAGLVDDTGMAFGFKTSMPQSLLGSVSASLRRQHPAAAVAPVNPPEPELTVWISRDGAPTSYHISSAEVQGDASRGQGRDGTSSTGREGASRNSGRGRGHVVTNNLQEPLIFGDETIGRGVAVGGTSSGNGGGVAGGDEEGKESDEVGAGGER